MTGRVNQMTNKVMSKEDKEKLLIDKKEELNDTLSVAQIHLQLGQNTTFIASQVMRMQKSFVADLPMPTAGADGKNIVIDPEFWLALDKDTKKFVLFHEAMHNLFGHMDRRETSKADALAWNIAADAVVNAVAITQKIGKQVKEGICPQYDGSVHLKINGKQLILPQCQNKSVEDVYWLIMKHVQTYPGDKFLDENGNPVGAYDNHQTGEMTIEDKNEREEQLRQMLVEHKLRGTLPGGLAQMIENMLKGKVNWKAEIRDMIEPEIKAYQTYSKYNRRSAIVGVSLPGMRKEGLNVTFAIDTSGSIGQKELEYYLGEIKNLFQQFEPGMVNAKIMFHHTNVYETLEVKDFRDIVQPKIQSGGTDHHDVFERAEEDKAKVLILLTDGESSFPASTTIQKVLWIITNTNADMVPAHLGKRIVIDLKDLSDD
jgi:predicted metal-dependent peptidase